MSSKRTERFNADEDRHGSKRHRRDDRRRSSSSEGRSRSRVGRHRREEERTGSRQGRRSSRDDERRRHRDDRRGDVASERSGSSSRRRHEEKRLGSHQDRRTSRDEGRRPYHGSDRRGDVSPPRPGPSNRRGPEEARVDRGRENSSRGRGRGGPGGGGRGGRGGRGGGRGRGRARGGGRGACRDRQVEDFDLVVSRPPAMNSKQANLQSNPAQVVPLKANYFRVTSKPNWAIYHYRVDFSPDETDTFVKKQLLKLHGRTLGAYIFDGSSLYVISRLSPDPMFLESTSNHNEKVEITIRLVAELAPPDVMYLQLYNIIVRKCLEMMGLQELGRYFYDHLTEIPVEVHRLNLWLGYKTSMRNHERDILLGVELTHKVLRRDNCNDMIMELRGRGRKTERQVRDELAGSIVLTVYNNKTYSLDDINWSISPSHTFDMRGRQISFEQYFQEKYHIRISDMHQPMLVSRPKKKDLHRGMSGPILLVPELCLMTGFTDGMRQNHQMMRSLASYLKTEPAARMEKLAEFMGKLQGSVDIQAELEKWGLGLDRSLVELNGHVVANQIIRFGEEKMQKPNSSFDWSEAFKNFPMYDSKDLKTWAMIVPSRDSEVAGKLLNHIQRVALPLKFKISDPVTIHQVSGQNLHIEYARAVDQLMNQYKNEMQMLLVILPNQSADIYSAVKKRACIEFGVPSQCFVAKNARNDKSLRSICTKLVVQMGAKLGAEPWNINIPLQDTMIIGYDVHHCGKRKGSSVGAMVATIKGTYGNYFSTISFHRNREELSDTMGSDFTKCMHAYKVANGKFPGRIVIYRDGVGDGQLKFVFETELEEIKKNIDTLYPDPKTRARLTFIVVTKKINARFFEIEDGRRVVNPKPGTVVDDVITLPERYDFYLVSQCARQGTVSPTAYNIIHDESGLDADKMQKLTYKLCHMYFNWSGTVGVPAPCQYAKKLSYLTGLALGAPCHEKLSNSLYFL